MKEWPSSYGLKRFEVLDSTNEEARRLAHAGETGPIWIMAARQSAGRGRRGRVWQSPEGNLAATLLLAPDKPREEWPQLSFVGAIAVADAVKDFALACAVTVKWPNDVLAGAQSAEVCSGLTQDCATNQNFAKIAGILLESGGGWLALGIGVNLAHFPTDTEYPATSIAALGVPAPTPEAALTAVAVRFAKWYEIWRAEGFGPVRAAWLARAGGLGEPICARLQDEERFGVFEGIDSTGALLLGEGGGTRAISAADIFPI